jgi:archaellum component FlaF (FlaF/FlaG flagellin family)
MELRLSYEVNEAQNTITVYVMGRATTDINATCKLYVGVIEKEIHFTSAPGPNGERDFYSVMKKMLPNSGGTAVGTLAANDYFAYTFTWELANIYNMDQLDAIAWVQNTNTKEVYQACKSSQTLVPFFANEASASEVSNMKSVNCSGVAAPKFTLTNNGSNTLTTAALEVLINGETMKTMTWSGSLPTFASEVVDLGEIEFPVEEDNILEVKVVSINGVDDEFPGNNMDTYRFNGAPDIAGKDLKLTIRTDANPQETTWRVTNLATGEIVQEGGPYELPNHKYDEVIVVSGDGCYDFTIFDAGGNGFAGSGLYGIKAGSTTLFSGRVFGESESNEFSYEVVAGTEEVYNVTASIYPNPTSGVVNIVSKGEQNVTIYNIVGQRVFEGVSNGYLQIDMKAYGAGIYAIQVGDTIQKIVVK